MFNIIVVGAGGFARELYELMWDCLSPWEYRFKGFLGRDADELEGFEVDAQVVADPHDYQPHPDDRFLLAIGDIGDRKDVVEALAGRGAQFLSLIHPTALVAATARVGAGAVIYPYAIVSNEATLDDYVHLSNYASVGHDARVGRFSLMAPYATLNGFSIMEDEVYLSTHSTVAPGVRVGRNSKVSANTAVIREVAPNSFVFGVPGRQTRRIDTR